MRTSDLQAAPRAVAVAVSESQLVVTLADGRELRVPLTWFPRLVNATHTQRCAWRLTGGGLGISWPDLDEDLSVAALLDRP